MLIRNYRNEDEVQWIRTRVLAFLDTSYFDSVYKAKEKYENPSIELVSEQEGLITGILDLELDSQDRKVCKKDSVLSAMIWHIAVHPDFRRQGIASALLKKAEQLCREKEIYRIEAWTRDDDWVRKWYFNQGFEIGYSYLHINLESQEMERLIESKLNGIIPVKMFAHFNSSDENENIKIKNLFRRVNECVMFEKLII